MILNPDRVLHRARRNFYSLNDEGHPEQGHDQSHYRRLEILTHHAFLNGTYVRAVLLRLNGCYLRRAQPAATAGRFPFGGLSRFLLRY